MLTVFALKFYNCSHPGPTPALTYVHALDVEVQIDDKNLIYQILYWQKHSFVTLNGNCFIHFNIHNIE